MKIIILKSLCLLLTITSIYGDDEVKTFNKNNPSDLPTDKVFLSEIGQIVDVYQTGKVVRNLLVPLSGYSQESGIYTEPNSFLPPIYYNLIEDGVNIGQYVFINKTQHKINNGRDATADLPDSDDESNLDNTIYIGAEDGIYTYNPETRAVEKYGSITEDIIAIDKVSGKDEIYILTTAHKIYKVTQEGTVKTQVEAITYAEDFVLDLAEGIYFSGRNNKPYLLAKGKKKPHKLREFNFDIVNPILVRPVFGTSEISSKHIIPYIVDGVPYILDPPNDVISPPIANVVPGITAFNAEFVFYHFYAVDGKIYLHNILLELESGDIEGTKKQGAPDTGTPLRASQRDAAVDIENFRKVVRSKKRNE